MTQTRAWQLQDAKNRFSERVNAAQTNGPQIITRRGAKIAVVVAYEEYARCREPRGKISQFFRESPLGALDLSRDRSLAREGVEL